MSPEILEKYMYLLIFFLPLMVLGCVSYVILNLPHALIPPETIAGLYQDHVNQAHAW